MAEFAYLKRYPFRVVLIHASAWITDRTLPVAVLGSGMGGEKSAHAGSSDDGDDVLFGKHVVDDENRTLEDFNAGTQPQAKGNLRTSAKLPPWFDRSGAKRFVVGGLEDPMGRLQMMQWKMGGSTGLFIPRGQPPPLPANELNLYDSCRAIGASLSGRSKGHAKGW